MSREHVKQHLRDHALKTQLERTLLDADLQQWLNAAQSKIDSFPEEKAEELLDEELRKIPRIDVTTRTR